MSINYIINLSLNCKRFKKRRCRLLLEDQERKPGKDGIGDPAFCELSLALCPTCRRGRSRLVPGSADPLHEDTDCKGAEEKSTGAGDPCAGCRAAGTRNMLPGVRETWQLAGIDLDQVPHGTMSI